jgi:hypothetical protein
VSSFDRIVEARIREADREGLFRDLPTRGKPLELEDLSRMPEDLRACYSILKNANVLPEEMCLRKEQLTLSDMLRACRDDEEAAELRDRLENVQLRYAILMERRLSRRLPARYRPRAARRLGLG